MTLCNQISRPLTLLTDLTLWKPSGDTEVALEPMGTQGAGQHQILENPWYPAPGGSLYPRRLQSDLGATKLLPVCQESQRTFIY